MKEDVTVILICMITSVILVACGTTQTNLNAQDTRIATDVFATQSAEALTLKNTSTFTHASSKTPTLTIGLTPTPTSISVPASTLTSTPISVSANDLTKYLPDRVGEFTATGPATREDHDKYGSVFHRAQRWYESEQALLAIAIIEGFMETLPIGEKTTIQGFDAMLFPPDNNMVAASVKLGPNCRATAIVLNTENTDIPLELLEELKLNYLAELCN
jgi:hypothetical protein